MNRRKLSFLNRVRFVLGLPMHNVLASGCTDKELETLISGAIDEMNRNLKKIEDEKLRKFILNTAALQLRVCMYNTMEAGYPNVTFNTIFKDQP